jgi:pimeloyl-ACP methyl ester carboxylesterase
MLEPPPAKSLLLRETGSFACMRLRASFAPTVRTDVAGDGRNILVLPGFMASDRTTSRLRRSLNAAGFRAHGWGLGRNGGVRADVFERLDARIDSIASEGPITLIGWSLGGIIAREYAKRSRHPVCQVITLGSPFSGHPRANNAWRVYEMIAGHKVDAPPVDAKLHEKPPVPTIAFWSPRDGVVAPGSARGLPGEADEAPELACTHMAFVADPFAIRAIVKAVAGKA